VSDTYEHFIYSDNPSELARAYQDAGYIADVEGTELVKVYTDLDGVFNGDMREDVERIAEEHGANYDGGGCYVGPLTGLA
jgi:hypothetical protein